ncbi:MAG: AAA family ATPase, partial [Bacteroidetes bacterium SW_10_40_5]
MFFKTRIMDAYAIESLARKSFFKVENVPFHFKRYLHNRIDWTDRLILIKGARGSGKTTLLLQHIKETHGLSEEALYVSLDDIWFAENRLVDLAAHFSNLGGKHLYLDKVHKYHNWSQEIKNIYDDHPELQLILTGSSALHLFSGKGDLSRRAMVYEMNELSLREFIALEEGVTLPAYKLEEVLENHRSISMEILQQAKPVKALKTFFKTGNYPYFTENQDNYPFRLQNAVNTTLETDLPAILNIDYSSVTKLKKILYVIATSAPFKPNIADLSKKVGVA